MTWPRWIALVGAVIVLCLQGRARATVIDTANFAETTWFSAGGTRTGMAWAPDGTNRLFVISKDGTVDIVHWGSPPTMVNFATLSPVYNNNECGLVGLTLDPNFQVNHYVYFFATVSVSEQQIIRYTASGDVGTDKTIIVSGLPTLGLNHDGGAIGIGPDGKIYWGIGDLIGAVGVNADLTSLGSKIGRANRDGTVPNDNPFFDGSGPNNDYIWARGFRNPFTLTFQSSTGDLWVNVPGTQYEQVFLVRKGDHAGYNVYENNQAAGFITPIIKYRTNGNDTVAIAVDGAARSSGIATFTTSAVHGFRQGERLDISGVTDTAFNGSFYVASVPQPTIFTVVQSGPDVTSGGGNAITQNQGGCVTGGSFYDGTQFSSAYRGNFFYGDYNSGRLMRAVLGAGNTVASVDYWGTDVAAAIDTSIGPDGALYYMGLGGTIYRARYITSTQGIVLSSTYVWMDEQGQTSVSVSLATAPQADISVSATRISGDPDVSVGGSGIFTFTSSNWQVPQVLTLVAADDLDIARDTATIQVSSAGLPSEELFVNVIDDDANALVLSQAGLALTEGGQGTFTVALASPPAGPLSVTVARASGDPDVTVVSSGNLAFDSANFATPQTVTVAAAEDSDLSDDVANLSLSAPGLTNRTVVVTVKDNDPAAPVITSNPTSHTAVNAPYRYAVTASGFPAPTFALTSSPAGMTVDSLSGIIDWIPHEVGSFSVTILAENGVSPSATQTFLLNVEPDAAPTCSLTRPVASERVSGTNTEFFGDGFDDVGTTKADFFIDGVLGSTDVNTLGHYHFGGQHNHWDTTVLPDGNHEVKMVVSDTIGQTCEAKADVIVANRDDGGSGDAGVDAPDGSGHSDAPTDRSIEVDAPRDVAAEENAPLDVAADVEIGTEAAADGGGTDVGSDPRSDLVVLGADVTDTGNVVTDAELRQDSASSGPSIGGSGCGCEVARTQETSAASTVSRLGVVAVMVVRWGRRRGRTTKPVCRQ